MYFLDQLYHHEFRDAFIIGVLFVRP